MIGEQSNLDSAEHVGGVGCGCLPAIHWRREREDLVVASITHDATVARVLIAEGGHP